MSQAQYTSDIVRLIEQQGQNAAAAAERRGQIWGGTLASLGQIPAQMQQAERLKQQQQLQQAELGLRNQQIGLETARTGLEVNKAKTAQADQDAFDQLLSNPDVYNADHTLNRDALAKMPVPGHLRPKINDLADHLDESATLIAQKQQTLDNAHREAVGNAALKIDATGGDPDALRMALTSLVGTGAMSKADATRFLAQGTTPEGVTAVTKQMKAGTKAATEGLKEIPKGGSLIDLNRIDPTTGKPKVIAEGAPENVSEFDTFRNLYAAQQGKTKWEQLSPPQQAAGFKAFVEAKADPAAQRQADALKHSSELQAGIAARQLSAEGRRQDFAEATAGRAVLTKAEQQYQTALASSQTLRDTVAAAKGGNKIAGSLQSLETTMAAIRAQGLNRINTVEIGSTANAGSMWDRVQGWLGKATEGQPIPDDIQKDMTEFAGILEKSAYKKYADAHKSVTTRYGLKNEPVLPAPDAATPTPAATGGTPGLTYADYLKKKGG